MSSPEEESEQEGFPTLLHCYELASIIAHHPASKVVFIYIINIFNMY